VLGSDDPAYLEDEAYSQPGEPSHTAPENSLISPIADETGEKNAFEQLQEEREDEFMRQLLAALEVDAPQEVYAYLENDLKERLHQMV
jgi:hypothetical protein